ncbi:hybrid signal transduction histidine kinase M [Tanacetum coccineum]
MTGGTTSTDKIIPFSIPNKVPIKLDLEKHNYNAWSSFSLIHLGSLGLKDHVESDTASTNPDWAQLDDLIKMWILSSLCDSLQEQVVTTPGNAKKLWDRLKELFHDNKDNRAINLDNKLRSFKIGSLTVNEYCTQIRSMADRLTNLGGSVTDTNLVIYTINGLDSRFATLVEIIRHREPLPSFETTRSMLLLKESSFTESPDTSTTFDTSSSSPTILMAESPSNKKGNTSGSSKSVNNLQLCNHFSRGSCKFGDRCRYVHDARNRAGSTTRNTNPRHTAINPHPWNAYLSANRLAPRALSHHDTSGTLLGIWDYSATSHLNSSTRNLSSIFYTRLYSSIHVGDGNSILVTNTGHSIIHSPYRPLHLNNVLVTPNIIKNLISVRQFTRDNNCTIEFDAFGFSVKDFLTRHILLRCDSSGDLYPVTKPSSSPAAFVSTSSTT